jgi:hypothetical protein
MADIGRRAPLAPTAQNDTQAADETRMRRALGLGSGSGQHTPQQRPEQARARHRFVQDGGVPVVMLNAKAEPETAALREKITTLEGALENERHQNEQLRRQMKEHAEQVTALQTRLAHNELAHRDALEQERHLRMMAQEALQEALAAGPVRRRAVVAHEAPALETSVLEEPGLEEPGHEKLGHEAAADSAADGSVHRAPVQQAAASDAAPAPKRGRGRPRSVSPPEPKPVRWWTPSYRSKTKA